MHDAQHFINFTPVLTPSADNCPRDAPHLRAFSAFSAPQRAKRDLAWHLHMGEQLNWSEASRG
jgi:hypothetical protein